MIPAGEPMDTREQESHDIRRGRDAEEIVRLTHGITRLLDVGDPFVRRSLHMEATALISFWIASFSEDTPSMHAWARTLSGDVAARSQIPAACAEAGTPGAVSAFLENRAIYYANSGATWKFDERLFSAWLGAVQFALLLSQRSRSPVLMPQDTTARSFLQPSPADREVMDRLTGTDCLSQSYMDIMGDWLHRFLEEAAAIVHGSNKAHVLSLQATSRSGQPPHPDPMPAAAERDGRPGRSHPAGCLLTGFLALVIACIIHMVVFVGTGKPVSAQFGFIGVMLHGFGSLYLARLLTRKILRLDTVPYDDPAAAKPPASGADDLATARADAIQQAIDSGQLDEEKLRDFLRRHQGR
jgi:hypothetical protein